MEKHYILLLSIHKHGYLGQLPYYITENLNEFTAAYNTILGYHYDNIYPVLQNNGMDIIFVCNLFKKCLKDPLFQTYKNFAVLAPVAYEILKSYFINTEKRPGEDMDVIDRIFLQNLENFVELPLQQLRKYKLILKNLIEVLMQTLEEHREDVPVEIMKYVADVQVEFEKFERLVQDTYKIHSKKSFHIKVKNLGQIHYSDLVVMEYDDIGLPRHRIFLMQTAVLAVRISRNDTKDESNETFDTFIWTLPYELVQYRHSVKIDERIKIFSKQTKYQQYSIIFKSGEKKKEFLQKLNDILEKSSGFTSFVENN